jgi:hypothetical protein
MRYYDIASRVLPVNCAIAALTTGATTLSTADDTMRYVNATGYHSFMVNVCMQPLIDDVSEYVELSIGLQTASSDLDSAETTEWSDVYDYDDSTESTYRKIYVDDYKVVDLATKLDATVKNYVTGGWQAQPYRWTSGATTTNAPIINARLVGSLRRDEVLKYIAPKVLANVHDDGDTALISVTLLLGAGDSMPVMVDETAALAGTDYYYSQGQ